MRQGEVGLLTQGEGQQLQGAIKKPEDFHQLVLAVVTSDFRVLQPLLIGKFADLKGVARSQRHVEAARAQLLDDRLEERNVRRVVEIDPDFLALRRRGGR